MTAQVHELGGGSQRPLGYEPVRRLPDARPLLFVVVDTEEEFDWDAPFSRRSTGGTAMRHIDRLQSVLADRRNVPTYVIDFPVASQPEGCGPLKALGDNGTV